MGKSMNNNDDYKDIEAYLYRSGLIGQSVANMRPFFPRWRRQLLKNGIDRISLHDARANNLMTLFVNEAMPLEHQDKEKMHNLRNIIYAQDIPIMRDRGWKR